MPRVQVTFGRMVSDGNFGHETFAVTLEQDMLPDEPGDGEVTATLLGDLARRVVEQQLLRSGNYTVTRTLQRETQLPETPSLEPAPAPELEDIPL